MNERENVPDRGKCLQNAADICGPFYAGPAFAGAVWGGGPDGGGAVCRHSGCVGGIDGQPDYVSGVFCRFRLCICGDSADGTVFRRRPGKASG